MSSKPFYFIDPRNMVKATREKDKQKVQAVADFVCLTTDEESVYIQQLKDLATELLKDWDKTTETLHSNYLKFHDNFGRNEETTDRETEDI